jgi:prepilin-type N-terminal cleavage/methylation domain-containing protein
VGRRERAGFTLVELLVVIAIIGVLIALLMPAIQAAREAGRRTQCINNLKQIAIGWQNHHDTQKFFPSSGWGWAWVGDPDRGFTEKQPGGWAYNVLPFIEQNEVHDLGKGMPAGLKRAAAAQAIQLAPTVFYCPTRRRAEAYPQYTQAGYRLNYDVVPRGVRIDYNANSGDQVSRQGGGYDIGPQSLTAGDAGNYPWPMSSLGKPMNGAVGDRPHTGVSFLRSKVGLKHIGDGASHTYMLGEKYLSSFAYTDGAGQGDNENGYTGFNDDTNRYTATAATGLDCSPLWDGDATAPEDLWRFGSAHATIFNMALCDGSIRSVSYEVSSEVHRRLGSRSEGLSVDGNSY